MVFWVITSTWHLAARTFAKLMEWEGHRYYVFVLHVHAIFHRCNILYLKYVIITNDMDSILLHVRMYYKIWYVSINFNPSSIQLLSFVCSCSDYLVVLNLYSDQVSSIITDQTYNVVKKRVNARLLDRVKVCGLKGSLLSHRDDISKYKWYK